MEGLTEACGGVPVWQTLPSMHGPRADCAVAVSWRLRLCLWRGGTMVDEG